MRTVSERELQVALAPWLGQEITAQTDFCRRLCPVFLSWQPYRESISALENRLEHELFRLLYGLLGEKMTFRQDNNRYLRIQMEDLPVLADAALEALFMSWSIDARHYEILKEYAMEAGSSSAMYCLTRNYRNLLSEEEYRLMDRIVHERRPTTD